MITDAAILAAAPHLADILQAYFELQWQEIAQDIQDHGQRFSTDLSHWTEPMAEAVMPILAALWQQEAQRTEERLSDGTDLAGTKGIAGRSNPAGRTNGRHDKGTDRGKCAVAERGIRGRRTRRKEVLSIDVFDVFNPKVIEALERAAFAFCESTNATSTLRLDLAKEELRCSLGQGLQAGEAVGLLAKRTQEVFADPQRAFRIATTEASRAMHLGQYETSRESGETRGVRWTASSDACPLCLDLDGEESEFGQPFFVDSKGGPYAAVYFPPRH